MPRKTIHDRIREAAKKKIVVRITERQRAEAGFDVVYPCSPSPGNSGEWEHDCINVPTKAEALSLLLIKARCAEKLFFEIKVGRALPWCVACKKAHEKPTSAEHHESLKCRAKWREA